MDEFGAVDVHAHLLMPDLDAAVAGQPGLAAARDLGPLDEPPFVDEDG